VRELSNLIERAVLFCPGETLESQHFPSDVQGSPSKPVGDPIHPTSTSTDATDTAQIHLSFRLGESLADLEDRIINEVLQRSGGNKTQAAKHLGVTRWMLDRRRKPNS
jgi:two-component system response regulator AtoC